jgi:hypothetical protein
VSVIKEDGTVVDLIQNHAEANKVKHIDFDSETNAILWTTDYVTGGVSTADSYKLNVNPVPGSDVTTGGAVLAGFQDWNRTVQAGGNATKPHIQGDIITEFISNGGNGSYAVSSSGTTPCLNLLYEFPDSKVGSTSELNAMVAYTTTSYNTGWMYKDIKLATLSDTDATSQTGGTVADRSLNNNSVNVTGTITRTAVATGTDLVAYSGFSNSNYLQQPVNSDMQTGTGGFSVTAWFKTTSTATEYEGLIYYNRPGSIGEGFQIMMNNSNKGLYWYVYGPTNDSTTTEITGLNDGVWHQIVATHIDGRQQLFIDGVLKNTQLIVTGSINDAQAQFHIGRWYGNANVSDYWWRGSVTLVRHSASIPSAEQIKKMYEDEKVLFIENSQATLYGSSDVVTALGSDDTTNILHVGTSDGRSDFQGLRRINNTTVGITSAISASNELVAEQ